MKKLILICFLATIGCGKENKTTSTAPDFSVRGPEDQVKVGSATLIIKWPATKKPGPQKWVWYAPSFANGSQPMESQTGWMFDELRKQGIAVIGVDVGESYGSPAGRQSFSDAYNHIQSLGFAQHGCMILQSRGGLMGYTWILDNPGIVSCVAGIYPLLSLEDYAGISAFAPAWGVSPAWMKANLSSINPLDRAAELEGLPIFHLHGTADFTVHIEPNRLFVSRISTASLTEIPGQQHEWYSDELFHSQEMMDFIFSHMGAN